jgi:hypothetical protein
MFKNVDNFCKQIHYTIRKAHFSFSEATCCPTKIMFSTLRI